MNSYLLDCIMPCINGRIAWYEKAIALSTREIPWENGFTFPTPTVGRGDASNVSEWRGAIRELKNTLDMLAHAIRLEGVKRNGV